MNPLPILIVSGSSWWQMPLVSKLLAALVGAGAIVLLVKLMQATLIRRLNDPDSRYYVRKLVTLGGWLAVALLITVVFRDRLGGLTVAIGVASAGIAFALQEVIGSIAGWIAISFGNFFLSFPSPINKPAVIFSFSLSSPQMVSAKRLAWSVARAFMG